MGFATFEEFWPYYVGEHRQVANRALHYFGTVAAVALLAASVATARPVLAAFLPLGYAPPWIGHFFIERNRPATFRHPLWSLRGDFRMLWLAVRGKMRDEVAKVASA